MNRKAFTLIEILGVVVIIGLLFMLIAPNFNVSMNKTKERAKAAQAEMIYSATSEFIKTNPEVYNLKNEGTYCVSVSELMAVGKLPDDLKNIETGEFFDKNEKILVSYKNDVITNIKYVESAEEEKSCGVASSVDEDNVNPTCDINAKCSVNEINGVCPGDVELTVKYSDNVALDYASGNVLKNGKISFGDNKKEFDTTDEDVVFVGDTIDGGIEYRSWVVDKNGNVGNCEKLVKRDTGNPGCTIVFKNSDGKEIDASKSTDIENIVVSVIPTRAVSATYNGKTFTAKSGEKFTEFVIANLVKNNVGSFKYDVNVTDSFGRSASCTATLVKSPGLEVNISRASDSIIFKGTAKDEVYDIISAKFVANTEDFNPNSVEFVDGVIEDTLSVGVTQYAGVSEYRYCAKTEKEVKCSEPLERYHLCDSTKTFDKSRYKDPRGIKYSVYRFPDKTPALVFGWKYSSQSCTSSNPTRTFAFKSVSCKCNFDKYYYSAKNYAWSCGYTGTYDDFTTVTHPTKYAHVYYNSTSAGVSACKNSSGYGTSGNVKEICDSGTFSGTKVYHGINFNHVKTSIDMPLYAGEWTYFNNSSDRTRTDTLAKSCERACENFYKISSNTVEEAMPKN